MKILPLAGILLIVHAGCSRTPRGVPDSEEMALLMADVYTAESVIEFNPANYSNDSLKKVVKQSVLTAHKISQADFDSAIVWYGHNIEEYIKVCDRAVEILEKRRDDIPDDQDGRMLMVVAGDSAQVWPLAPFYHITSHLPSRYLTFNLPKDDTWEASDQYELGYKLLNMRSPVNSFIGVEYDDGGTVYATATSKADGWERLKIQLDSTRVAKSIYGFIKFTPETDEHIYVDSISLIRTRTNQLQRRAVRGNTSIFNRGNNSK